MGDGIIEQGLDELEPSSSIVADTSATVQEYDELAGDVELVENLNDTLENQLENNQANDASLEMYHAAIEQVFRKYNIPYKNNVVSTEDYSAATVSMEKQKGFLSNLKDGIWNIIVKVYNAIKDFFKKIFNMVFRRGKAKVQELQKDIKQNEKVYDAVYKEVVNGGSELKQKMESSNKATMESEDQSESSGTKFGHVKANPIIAPTNVSDGDYKKFNEEFVKIFKELFMGGVGWDLEVYIRHISDTEYNLEKGLTKYAVGGNKNISPDELNELRELYVGVNNKFTQVIERMTDEFVKKPIPGIKVTVSEDGRIHVAELERKNKITALPISHIENFKDYVSSLPDVLDSLQAVDKALISFDFETSMTKRKQFESEINKLGENSLQYINKDGINLFKTHNEKLMTLLANVNVMVKYIAKYVNALITYFDAVNKEFKRMAKYVS